MTDDSPAVASVLRQMRSAFFRKAEAALAEAIETVQSESDALDLATAQRSFLLAWVLLLEGTRVSGKYAGWHSAYDILHSDEPEHMPLSLALEGGAARRFHERHLDQWDLIFPPPAGTASPFTLIRLHYRYARGDDDNWNRSTVQLPAVSVFCCPSTPRSNHKVFAYDPAELEDHPFMCVDAIDRFFEAELETPGHLDVPTPTPRPPEDQDTP